MNLLSAWCLLVMPGHAPADQFEVFSTGDKLFVGAIEQLDPDGTLLLADQTRVSAGALISLRRLAEPQPEWPSTARAVLHNGDQIVGAPLELKGALLSFRAPSVQRAANDKTDGALHIPLTTISYLWFRSATGLDRERHASFFAESRALDQVLLRNGDLVSGSFVGLDMSKGELQIASGEEQRVLALNKVMAIALSTKLARLRKPAGPYGHLVLADGTRLTVTAIAIKNGLLNATTTFRDKVAASLNEMKALDIYQGPATYLSDLKPSKYEYHTYQGEEYGLGLDRNLAGNELRLKTAIGIQTFDKGVAVHGQSSVTYTLDGDYRRFESVVGLDASLGTRGSVDVKIRVDGKDQNAADGKDLNFENGPWRLKANIKGAKTLTLIVNWGHGGYIGDHVNWCDARVIR